MAFKGKGKYIGEGKIQFEGDIKLPPNTEVFFVLEEAKNISNEDSDLFGTLRGNKEINDSVEYINNLRKKSSYNNSGGLKTIQELEKEFDEWNPNAE
ncbi:MAG: hypothetical protein HYY52_03235 [Candidatus Melainabacteria bacterium]|nr:hypothetical protein [Candidatus Melainabacteria bacterium]